MKLFIPLLFSLLSLSAVAQPCTTGQVEVIVRIIPDNYPQESSWILQAGNGSILASGTSNSDTLCVPANTCMTFTMRDSYGDGMCCQYGVGSFTVFVNGVVRANGGNFTFQSVHSFNCGPGQSCATAIVADTLTYTAPHTNSWYSFKPDTAGAYTISTCGLPNTCNTAIWVYDNCGGPILDSTNIGTLFYNDDAPGCGQLSQIQAYLDTSTTYLIRIGGNSSCLNDSIRFRIQFVGAIIGCTDTLACNYDPMALPGGTCYYFPSTLCPPGPDLTVVQSVFENSLRLDSINAQNCMVQEQCLTGYGMRTIIRFTTDIRNIGQTDFYIGNANTQPGQFNTNNCHGHAHYEGYAEYVLYRPNGNTIPVGFKNGFCVLDLSCPQGIPAKYGCNNMGITAGCGDIYGAGLDCQWIDITNVPDGQYILAMKVNWDHSPDALGRYETTYANNWSQVCLNIFTNSAGRKRYTKLPNCTPYVDCRGTLYGNARPDCNGDCAGTARYGDYNSDSLRNASDLHQYMTGIALDTINYRRCLDVSGDSLITVWDAALVANCLIQSSPTPCEFPRGVRNALQQARLNILSIDTVQRTIDIGLANDDGNMLAFEFGLRGLALQSGFSLLPPQETTLNLYIRPNGKVVGMIASHFQTINRSGTPRPLVRLLYSQTTDSLVHLLTELELVNAAYEAVGSSVDSTIFHVPFSTTSVAESLLGPTFVLYPNPSSGELNLRTADLPGLTQLRVVNALGQTVWQRQLDLSSGFVNIDLQALPPAVYQLVLEHNGKRSSKRFIRQNQ